MADQFKGFKEKFLDQKFEPNYANSKGHNQQDKQHS